LGIAERDTRIEGGRDEGVPQAVGADPLGDAGCLGDPAHHAGYGVAGEPVAVDSDEGRVLEAIADGQIECSGGPRCEGDGDGLAALAVRDQGPGASFEAELFDVDAERLGDP
jgi:hypothetical protein